jgi:double-stranded uracil-DNA glycosylase
MPQVWRPKPEEVRAAGDKTVPDVLGLGLRVLFCGINPGLYSAAVGHHFARPGNRFWPALHASGFTPRLLSPFEDGALLELGYGITNVVERASASAGELSPVELAEGGRGLVQKVAQYRPQILAVLGVGAYRTAFEQRTAELGRQPEAVGGAITWVLPNPSGLNAHYRLGDLIQLFTELRGASEALSPT